MLGDLGGKKGNFLVQASAEPGGRAAKLWEGVLWLRAAPLILVYTENEAYGVVWGFGDPRGSRLQPQADSSTSGGFEGKKSQSPALLRQPPEGLKQRRKAPFPCLTGEDEHNVPLRMVTMTCKLSLRSSMPQFPQEGQCRGRCARGLWSEAGLQDTTISSVPRTLRLKPSYRGRAGGSSCPLRGIKS